MEERIRREIEMLREKYPSLEVPQDATYLLVHEMALPSGWNRSSTDLLVLVPPGYPATPPDNFFVPAGFRLGNDQPPANYAEGTSINEQQWGQFSFHSQEWNPTSEPDEGDNLLTYFVLIERRLGEVN